MRFYKHADDFPPTNVELPNVCQWCGEIPEDCDCNKGEGINAGLKEIRGLAIGIVQTADDQLVGPRDRPNVGDVIADCAGLAETIKEKAERLMEKYDEGRGQ